MENKYIYETHLHTSTASACGKSKGNEYISLYKELGFSGIFVTDHFFNGNCGVPENLSWKERINLFCKGYEEAKDFLYFLDGNVILTVMNFLYMD